jgi:hypothetical protein
MIIVFLSIVKHFKRILTNRGKGRNVVGVVAFVIHIVGCEVFSS